jgi:protein-S-isoprenylcysteine O-methyltransferase Ste14
MTKLPGLGPRGEGWVLLQGLLIVLVAAAGWSLGPDWSGAVGIATALVGLAAMVAGLVLAVRGARDLGTALTPLPRPAETGTLVESGVYRFVRHPIYGGVILLAVGWALLRASGIAIGLAVLLAAVLWLKSLREERWLEGRFPGYPAYRSRTGWFVPRIGRRHG